MVAEDWRGGACDRTTSLASRHSGAARALGWAEAACTEKTSNSRRGQLGLVLDDIIKVAHLSSAQ